MSELLPCPFCGDSAFSGTTLDGDHYVMCRSENCWAMAGYLPTKAEAIAAWNRRSEPSEPVAVTDEMVEQLYYWWGELVGKEECRAALTAALRVKP